MTTTEWMERYNRAFEDAGAAASYHEIPLRKFGVERDKPKLPPELIPPGYVELGYGLRVEWDKQNKRYKLADLK